MVSVKKGDRFVIHGPAPLFIEVTRVGKSGWVDIRCQSWAVQWSKRMPKGIGPLLEGPHPMVPSAWTWDDVRASEPEALP